MAVGERIGGRCRAARDGGGTARLGLRAGGAEPLRLADDARTARRCPGMVQASYRAPSPRRGRGCCSPPPGRSRSASATRRRSAWWRGCWLGMTSTIETRCECASDPRRCGGLRRRTRPVRRAARSLGGGSAAERSVAPEDPRQPLGVPCAAGRRAGPGTPAPAARAARRSRGGSRAISDRWSDFIIGLSYLWEGQVLLAERILRPALLQADADLGRRNPFSVHARGAAGGGAVGARTSRARRSWRWRTGWTCSSGAGCPRPSCSPSGRSPASRRGRSEARALELLEGLDAVGAHARPAAAPGREPGGTGDAARAALSGGDLPRTDGTDRRAARCGRPVPRAVSGGRAPRCIATWPHGYAAIAARDWRAARAPFERANAAARAAKRQRLLYRNAGIPGPGPAPLRRGCGGLAQEAVELAKVYGLTRVFEAAHPTLGERLVRIAARAPEASSPFAEPRRASPPPARRRAKPRWT